MKKKLECGDLIVADPDIDPILLLIISRREKSHLKLKPSWFIDEGDSYFCMVIASNFKKNSIPSGDMDWWDLSEETTSFLSAQGRRCMYLRDFLEEKKCTRII